MLCQPLPERSVQWHCKVLSGIHRVLKWIYSLCVCRPASLVCTEHSWITTRLLWRRRTSAARQTLSLQRYLRYVITLCTVGQRQTSVWCCTAALDEWWQGSFQQSSQCKRAMQLFTELLIVLIALWGSCWELIRVFFSHHSLWCYLPRISRSKAQRTAKTSRLKIHWKVSIEWNEWPAST